MKRSKKTLTALSFTIGTCLFVSTAFADMTLGSGYDRLKDAAKQTAAQMEKGLNSYTIEAMYTLKDNGQNLVQFTSLDKFDTQQRTSESSTVSQYANGESTSSYSYSDPQQSIWKDMDGKYYVSEIPKGRSQDDARGFRNPFNEDGAAEVEKIVDAVVGNLKDYVQAEERPEGGRAYSGTLSEAQVPALVNAVSSFVLKQMISEQGHRTQEMKFPKIESDVYVKKVTGTALENKSGVLEHLTADFVVSGKDKDGAQHDLSLNLVFKLSDINSTTVTKPDLTGASVEKVSRYNNGFSDKYVGTYKNDIVVEKDGDFVKVGERVLEIKSMSDNKVTGAYSEVVVPGFESEYPEPYHFDFEYTLDDSKPNNFFTYTDPQGKQRNGELHPGGGNGKVYVTLNIEVIDEHSYRSDSPENFDGQFNRVFE